MLDSLCESSLVAHGALQAQNHSQPLTSSSTSASQDSKNEPFYIEFVRKDLSKLVDLVVPEGREGLANLMSTTQVILLSSLAQTFVSSSIFLVDITCLEDKTGF
jgi:CTD kinase subunit gamma